VITLDVRRSNTDMNDTVYKIALAGLLHDIGKFVERYKI